MKHIKLFEGFYAEKGDDEPKGAKKAPSIIKKLVKKPKDIMIDEVKLAIDMYLHEFVNHPMEVTMYKDGWMRFETMAGSSLRKACKDAVKKLGLDKWFDVKNMTFDNGGDDHIYAFPPIGKGHVGDDQMTDKEFIEDYVNQAVEDLDKWLRTDDEPDLYDVIESLDDFSEIYNGEFLEKVFYKNQKKIAKMIYDRIK